MFLFGGFELATTDTSDAGTMTRSQQERRRRILDATRALAIRGGYDGVQMRDVAEHADVALGTLYRYFPSKTHLLVGLMRDATSTVVDRAERRSLEGATASVACSANRSSRAPWSVP
jgi:AcrR family transcriptional regulator